MRLSCPNCEAQYQVPDDVIPTDGRDVQCSNCGQTWFVSHRARPAPPPKPAAPKPEAQAPTPQKRAPVPDEVKRVLRQEAEREQKARQAEANAALEVQEELGIEAPEKRQPDQEDQAGRKSQLPDIEEINSTLAATPVKKREKRAAPTSTTQKGRKRRRGFRIGFILALIILAILTSLYVYAPNLTDAFPQYADYVNHYVIWVNDMRQLLFTTAEQTLTEINAAGTTPAATQ